MLNTQYVNTARDKLLSMLGLAVKLEIELDVLLSENIGATPSIPRILPKKYCVRCYALTKYLFYLVATMFLISVKVSIRLPISRKHLSLIETVFSPLWRMPFSLTLSREKNVSFIFHMFGGFVARQELYIFCCTVWRDSGHRSVTLQMSPWLVSVHWGRT